LRWRPSNYFAAVGRILRWRVTTSRCFCFSSHAQRVTTELFARTAGRRIRTWMVGRRATSLPRCGHFASAAPALHACSSLSPACNLWIHLKDSSAPSRLARAGAAVLSCLLRACCTLLPGMRVITPCLPARAAASTLFLPPIFFLFSRFLLPVLPSAAVRFVLAGPTYACLYSHRPQLRAAACAGRAAGYRTTPPLLRLNAPLRHAAPAPLRAARRAATLGADPLRTAHAYASPRWAQLNLNCACARTLCLRASRAAMLPRCWPVQADVRQTGYRRVFLLAAAGQAGRPIRTGGQSEHSSTGSVTARRYGCLSVDSAGVAF